jgi:hypothetical protein
MSDYREIESYMVKYHGEPELRKIIWKDKRYLGTMEKALCSGDLIYFTEWKRTNNQGVIWHELYNIAFSEKLCILVHSLSFYPSQMAIKNGNIYKTMVKTGYR